MKYLIIALCFLLTGCNTTKQRTGESNVVFKFVHTSRNEVFYASTTDTDLIATVRKELSKPIKERSFHISGLLERGAGNVNDKWSWHFVPGQWGMSELSMEVCDAWPSYIEENLDVWLSEVGSFCPWASRVYAEM